MKNLVRWLPSFNVFRIYRRFFSPDTGILGPVFRNLFPSLSAGVCRFYPSCSDYARTSISQYGLCRGLVMSFQRILRCHPWSEGGYDPPPTNYQFSMTNFQKRQGVNRKLEN